jgi:hypothetical protein
MPSEDAKKIKGNEIEKEIDIFERRYATVGTAHQYQSADAVRTAATQWRSLVGG